MWIKDTHGYNGVIIKLNKIIVKTLINKLNKKITKENMKNGKWSTLNKINRNNLMKIYKCTDKWLEKPTCKPLIK